jgi:hypothetical protein
MTTEEGQMHAKLAIVMAGTNDLDRYWSRQLDDFEVTSSSDTPVHPLLSEAPPVVSTPVFS